MNYQIVPIGGVWQGGMFSVPQAIADKYLKLSSEYQIKALLIVLGSGGVASSADIAKRLGITEADAQGIMEFWLAEGVLSADGASALAYANQPPVQAEKPAEPEPKRTRLEVKPPVLTPAEVKAAALENPQIEELFNEAQVAFGRTISTNEEMMLVNLVNFYGMAPEIILMILTFAKAEKEKGSLISASYIYKIVENWLEEGIITVALAEEKLRAVEGSNRLWREISEKCALKKTLTPKQVARVADWQESFSNSVILMAADAMMENAEKPCFNYLDTTLINWKKQGIKTEADVEHDKEQFRQQKKEKEKKASQGKISRKPSYDLEKIKKDILNNTEI